MASILGLAWLTLLGPAMAQYVVDSLSFGHQGQISPNGRALPGWTLTGQNHQPELFSDKVVLTPPMPGNTRGALWSDSTVTGADWTAELEFRASGQDTGTGNLNLWFTQDKSRVGDSSVYTVDTFDGLALVIDQYGGTGGKIRGFLNDGTQNYKAHSSLESLAFGHCDYSYRNLGRPSNLTITNQNGLTVLIDERECFRTDKASLPSGYYFGITAATAENPDSFEVMKFVVSTASPSTPQHLNNPAARAGLPPTLERLDKFPGAPEAVPDKDATEVKGQDEQFADLHNRLQGLTHQLADMFGQFDAISRKIDEKHEDTKRNAPASFPIDRLDSLSRRIEDIEQRVNEIKRDVEGRDYHQRLSELHSTMEGLKGGLTEGLPENISGRKSLIRR